MLSLNNKRLIAVSIRPFRTHIKLNPLEINNPQVKSGHTMREQSNLELKDLSKAQKKKQVLLGFLAILGSILIYSLDTFFDVTFFDQDESFWDSLILDVEEHEIYMRFFTISVFLSFTWVFNRLLKNLFKTQKGFLVAKISAEEANQTLNQAQQIAKIGDWSIDLKSKEQFWSAEYHRILGYQLHEVSPSLETFQQRVFKGDWAKVQQAFEAAVTNQEAFHIEYQLLLPDEQVRFVASQGVVQFGQEGEPTYFHATTQDITDRHLIREQLLQAKETADNANRAKSSFLTMMSHELRTPMNGVLGMTQVLKMTKLTEEQESYCDVILKSGTNLITILSDILDFAKIEANKQTVLHQPFSIREVMEPACALFQGAAMAKGLSLSFNVAPGIQECFVGDSLILSRVLSNLIGNAVKFTNEGEITVNLQLSSETADQQTIRFEVIDTGIGISRNKIQDIFDPFKQVDDAITREQGGTGLGLSIVKDLVELLGGKVVVLSTLGKGSCFQFACLFDRWVPGENLIDLPEEMVIPLVDRELEALVVEDDQINQQVTCKMLTKLNILADLATDGSEAFNMAKTKRYDIIFMDLLMPKMDGYQATQLIRNAKDSLNQDTPILALTAMISDRDKEKCIEYGFNEYISKPIDFEKLKNTIREYQTQPQ